MSDIVLDNIRANAHPKGNRIDLSWELPDGSTAEGVLLRRSTREYPQHPADGTYVSDIKVKDGFSCKDTGLKGETVYYYSFFPYSGNTPVYTISSKNVASAVSTAAYGNVAQMYELLPRIYNRYDTALPPDPNDVDDQYRDKGQLRRFLSIFGEQLDQLQSLSRTVLDLRDPEKIDGSLLPLLAQWIGWDTDFQLRYGKQRGEIENAPFLYERIGIIPTIEATVKRLIGWESRTKEFFQNVFLTNRPEQFNIRSVSRSDGKWDLKDRLVSLDYNYEGRCSAVTCKDGRLRLFYHAQRGDNWNIWMKDDDGKGGWMPGIPVTERNGIDKYPTALYSGSTLWVFWNSYDETEKKWHILSRRMIGDKWQEIEEIPGSAESKGNPAACADSEGGLWLFWTEGNHMKYRKYQDGWNVPSVVFPGVVEADPILLPLVSEKALYVFWASRDGIGEEKTWRISYRKKSNLAADDPEWESSVNSIAGVADRDDREPAPVLNEKGEIELFWSSNRSGNWLIWSSVLDPVNKTWSAPSIVLQSSYNQRAPVALLSDQKMVLFFGSNAGVTYQSSVYIATETIDNRYAGSTTVDVENGRKNHLAGDFSDFATYTYDTGKGQSDWYSRDTIGIYLTPDSDNYELINRNIALLASALSKFLPAQVRPVFIIETPVYREYVYSKDPEKGRDIGEYTSSVMEARSGDIYSGAGSCYEDALPDWTWIYSEDVVNKKYGEHRTADLEAHPPVTRYRIWHTGINRGG